MRIFLLANLTTIMTQPLTQLQPAHSSVADEPIKNQFLSEGAKFGLTVFGVVALSGLVMAANHNNGIFAPLFKRDTESSHEIKE
jgi:hypothetical protein